MRQVQIDIELLLRDVADVALEQRFKLNFVTLEHVPIHRGLLIGVNDVRHFVLTPLPATPAKDVGKRGQNEVTDIVYPNEKAPVNWHVLESDEVEFETFDLYEGDISDVARQQFNIDLDLAHQMESKLDPKTGLLSANVFGAFNLSGNKGARVYVPHSRIAGGCRLLARHREVPDRKVGGDLLLRGTGHGDDLGLAASRMPRPIAIEPSKTAIASSVRPISKDRRSSTR